MKKFKLPSAYTIVLIALIITAALSYFIPQSVFDKKTGDIVLNAILDGDGNILPGQGLVPFGIWDVLMAPIKGFQSASDVGVGLLVAGGFLSVLNSTGALDAGIGALLNKFQGSVLIAIMMFVFAILGTSFGFWEEIVAFAVVIIPLFVLAGYDVMTGLAIMFIGATVGNMASVVNPFSTGAAVSAIGNPDLTLGSGIVLRALLFIALYIIATAFVIQYAAKVKKNKELSILNGYDVNTLTEQSGALPEFTRKRKISVGLFIVLVVIIIFGYIPWEQLGGVGLYNLVNLPFTALSKVPLLGNLTGAAHVTPFGDWGFDEFGVLFLIGSLLLMIINRMSEAEFIKVFIDGMKDLLGVVVVLSIARGIAIIMGNSTQGMSITFIYWISNALGSVQLWVFGIFAIIAYVLIGIFLQSTSGVAGISMPILGAVAAALFAASAIGAAGGQIILISAFTVGVNFMSCLYPSATLMGTLELVNVPYDRYLKFTLKILIVLLIASAIIISIAPYMGII